MSRSVSIVVPVTRESQQQQLLRSIQSLNPQWLEQTLFITPADNGGDPCRNRLRNLGWNQAQTDFVLFLDDDTRLTEKACLAVSRFLTTATPPIWLSGPYGDDLQCSFWGRIYNRICNLWLSSAPFGERFLAGAVLLHKKEVPDAFRKTLFNEFLNSGGEEDDLAVRLKDYGLTGTFDRNFSVLHQSQHSLDSLLGRLRGHLGAGRQRRPVLTARALTLLLTSPLLWLGLVMDLKTRLVKELQ